MLQIETGGDEFFDEETQSFITKNGLILELEHSLISLSKWESKYKRPFLDSDEKDTNEVLDYIRFMITNENPVEDPISILTQSDFEAINRYIESPESATTFGEMPEVKGRRGERITSELIYYWLVAFNIPFEVENWHLNRLFSLIRICNLKNSQPKKMGRHEAAARNRELNARRRRELGTSG
jgi:hypothetical protein